MKRTTGWATSARNFAVAVVVPCMGALPIAAQAQMVLEEVVVAVIPMR